MRFAVGLSLLVALGVVAFAQQAQPQSTGPGPDYLLAEDDQIYITLAEEAERNTRTAIGGDGYVRFPYIGDVKAKGRTAGQLQEEITSRLIDGGYFTHPHIAVTVETYRKPRATVVGAETMQKPGIFEFRQGQRLRDLIGMAGGPVGANADLRRAILQRRDSGERIPIDLRGLLQELRDDQNYELQDGDVLTVAKDEKAFINVVGDVNQPGTYPYREGMYLTDAIASARYGAPDRGMLSKIDLIRQDPYDPTKVTRVHANYFEILADRRKDILLQRGDTVYVNHTNNLNWIPISSAANALYVVTILLRNNPFDAVVGALR